MAFPTIPTSAAGRILSTLSTAGGATNTFPSLTGLTKNAGDLLIAIIVIYDGNSTNAEFSSWGGGFTEFVDQATTATMGIGVAYKWSTGSETGTFTVTSADSSTTDRAMILLSIPGAHASTPPEGGTIVNGTSGMANIASLAPSWGVADTLFIAVGGSGETGTGGSYTGLTAAPTNYTDYFNTGISADAVGGVEGAVAFRQLRAASDDPGAFSGDTSNARNSALLLAIRPAPALVEGTASSTITVTTAATGEVIAPEPGHLILDGTGDYASTTDKTQLDITGDIEAIFCAALTDWTPATNMILASKWQADSAAGLSYAFRVANFSGGQLEFYWWNGSAIQQINVDNNGGVDGEHMWIKMTVDVDDGASGSVLTVYTSTDPIDTAVGSVSWSELGSDSSGPVISLSSTTQPLWLGLRSTSNDPLAGKIYYFELKDGIGGTTVALTDFRDDDQGWSSPPADDGVGNTWTFNGDADWVAPAGTIEGTASSIASITVLATGKVIAKATATIGAVVDIVGSPHLIAKGQASSGVVVDLDGTSHLTAKGQATSDVAVDITSTPKLTAKATGSSSAAVAVTATGLHIGVGQATSDISVDLTGTPHLIAKGQATSGVAVDIVGTPHLTARAQADSDVLVTLAATPLARPKGQATSGLILSVTADGQVVTPEGPSPRLLFIGRDIW